MTPLEQHQVEIQRNLTAWKCKPLLQELYDGLYRRIIARIPAAPGGRSLEIGSGIGNLKQYLANAICSDLFANPWLDLVCDGYELPFADGSLANIILFDVFHHLEHPGAFLKEAGRVLTSEGRILVMDPFISVTSHPVYGLGHHEPVGLRKSISASQEATRPRNYYAAQGNATRVFFRREYPQILRDWRITHAEAFSCFAYLLSGGFSKPALYPRRFLPRLQRVDELLSRWPHLFAGRCLVELQRRD